MGSEMCIRDSGQGVQISTGLSPDRRTRLMFIALLGSVEGEAIWFNGGAAIADGQSSIEIDLSLSRNLPFFDQDSQSIAERESVGTAEITVTGCDSIELDLQLVEPYGNRQVELFRVLDESFSELCVDG